MSEKTHSLDSVQITINGMAVTGFGKDDVLSNPPAEPAGWDPDACKHCGHTVKEHISDQLLCPVEEVDE